MKSATLKHVLTASFLALSLAAFAAPSVACANGPHHNTTATKPIVVIKNALKRVKGQSRATVSIKIKQHKLTKAQIKALIGSGMRKVEGAVRPHTVQKSDAVYSSRALIGGELKERVFNIQ